MKFFSLIFLQLAKMSSSPPDASSVKPNVRRMISLFENQTTPVKSEQTVLLKRAKSLGYLSKKTPYKFTERIQPEKHSSEMTHIGNQIDHLQTNLCQYEVYSKPNHIYYQNRIFHVLTDIVEMDTKNDPFIKNQISTFFENIKEFNEILNSKLPGEFNSPKIQLVLNKTETVPATTVIGETDISNGTAVPSVRKLKDLFERKTSENDGFKEVVYNTKSPRRAMSFHGYAPDQRYVPYKEKVLGVENEVTSLDANISKSEPLVLINTPIQRVHSEEKPVNVERLKALFEKNAEKQKSLDQLNKSLDYWAQKNYQDIKYIDQEVEDEPKQQLDIDSDITDTAVTMSVFLGEGDVNTTIIQREKASHIDSLEEEQPVDVGRLKAAFENNILLTRQNSLENSSKTAENNLEIKYLDPFDEQVVVTKSLGEIPEITVDETPEINEFDRESVISSVSDDEHVHRYNLGE